jgi:hypothetical protein
MKSIFKSKSGALPPEISAIIASWVENRIYKNPVHLLKEVLRDHGKRRIA